MEGITITKFESRARLDIDKIKIYLTNEEAEKFSSILEHLETIGLEDPISIAMDMAIRSFIATFQIYF